MEPKTVVTLTVKANDVNQTIFNFIKKMFQTTPLSVIYKLFRNKKIKVNNKVMKERNYKLQLGDQIIIFDKNLVVTERNQAVTYNNVETLPLQVVYEDDNILVVDKPHGVEMHSKFHTSLDAMVQHYLIQKHEYHPEDEQSFVISHVHRLDKLTRGLVLYAKNKITLDLLLAKINQKESIEKKYLAKCEGIIKETDFTLTGYLYKNEDKQKMVFTKTVQPHAKVVKTHFRVQHQLTNATWLEVTLITGRKHQIRASLSYLHHPIVNDIKYGAKQETKEYMIALYATTLIFHQLPDHLSYLNEKIIKIPENIIK
ncbi:pseudouridine synthase [Spiroplasma melliferum]|uniref:RNA pseudouridylate synthase n=2 Tax=Spiroplasma melliferum TaxID=2134 RepID=A0AAI9X0Z9_SPIME|nr:RluA family pseudouridine synthase [Spiroplasma melliferum]ELL44990.1 ribosomal large subunit pseudouridine synthase C [Spiroplasma melliferum IPMB4A]KAI92558.1 ribosomal large subunit pseudouridine synthase C [Spiroplasma melliferum KC3]QCO24145.1 ribosomal large subunit pseudouridine synthase C [Spiroplasma melliferum]